MYANDSYKAYPEVSLQTCDQIDPLDPLLPLAGCTILAFDEWKSVTHSKV